MGISQSGHCFIFVCKSRKVFQNTQQLPAQITQAVPVEDQIAVIGHITAGGTEMDNACRGGSGFAVGIDMGHHIMAHLFFPLRGTIEINVIDLRFQLRYLLRRDGQAEPMLSPRQRHPELSPCLDALFLREQMEHIVRSIAG